MLGFQAAPRLFSGQADEQFCLCSSEYEMSTCVIHCTNSHLFKGGVFDMRAQEGEGRCTLNESNNEVYCNLLWRLTNCH